MHIISIVRDTTISKEGAELIHSGLAPVYLGTKTEVYDLESIIEWMGINPSDFSKEDIDLVKILVRSFKNIEINTGNERSFKKILGF